MSYPFPGMDPWLEQPALWRDVHHSLISALRDDLSPRIRPRYFLAVETHTYVTIPPGLPPTSRYPDAMIIHRGGAPIATTTPAPTSPFITVELPRHDPLIEGYLEVRLVPTGEVVTVIELLSHTNKSLGHARDEYIEKRQSILDSHVHFVEIDLLRANPPMPYANTHTSDYRVFMRRREKPFQARVYPFNVREAIPTFPLPLLLDDEEPLVELGALIARVYERASYDLVIDYTRPPDPPLRQADAEWAHAQMEQQH